MVVAWHTSGISGYRLPVFGSAAIAVDVFMNVSGFLMVLLYFQRQNKEPWRESSTWVKFYMRRFFRITPLYYLTLLFVLSVYLTTSRVEFQPTFPIWRWLILHFSFLFGFIPSEIGGVIPDWSLTLEMQFYVCFPFLFLALIRLRPGLFFLLFSLVGAISQILFSYYGSTGNGLLGHFPQPTLLPLKIQVFCVGMIAAIIAIRGFDEVKSKWFILGFPIYYYSCRENYQILMFVFYVTLYCIILIPKIRIYFLKSIHNLNEFARGVPGREVLAECSYGTYLVHNVVICLIIEKIWPPLEMGQGTLTRFIYCFLLNLIITTGVSYFLYKTIELPGINIGRKFIQSHLFK